MNPIRRAALVLVPLALALSGLMPLTSVQAAEASESRNVSEFHSVAVSGSMDLAVRQGALALQVQADDKLLPLLETVVEQGTLQVRWKKGERGTIKGKVLVTVAMPRLNALSSSGSGDIQLSAFNTPALKLTLSGAGDARLEGLTTEDLAINISGSSDVVGSGSATRVKIAIAGSGDVKLAQLRADEVAIRIAGSGDAAVNAQKSLDVSIAGSGDVSYSGNAAVKSSVAGSGSINKR